MLGKKTGVGSLFVCFETCVFVNWPVSRFFTHYIAFAFNVQAAD